MDFWNRDNVWFYVSLVLAGILIFQAGMWYGQRGQTNSPTDGTVQAETNNAPTPSAQENNEANNSNVSLVSVDDKYSGIQLFPEKKAMGNPDAPVTVVEYLDVECPFCQRLNRNSTPKIIEEYVKPGTVYYRVKHFPLPIHDRAVQAGNALECAAQHGAFWTFKYTAMNSRGLDLTNRDFLRIARHVGISDIDQFETCVNDMSHRDTVTAEKNEGSEQGVSATPTLFVNGEKIEGAQPYAQIKQVIESKLTTE